MFGVEVFCGRGKDFADECVYLEHLLAGGGKAKVHAAGDPVDGVVPADEGVLLPGGGGVLPRVSARLELCVGGGDGPDAGHGPCGRPSALDPMGQAEHGQSHVVACPPRGDSGQDAGGGFGPRLEDAPEDIVWGGGVPYCPWWGGRWGENGVNPLDEPLWAGGRCCGG